MIWKALQTQTKKGNLDHVKKGNRKGNGAGGGEDDGESGKGNGNNLKNSEVLLFCSV